MASAAGRSSGDAGAHLKPADDGLAFDSELAETHNKIIEQQRTHFRRNRARGRVHTAAHHRE